MPPETAPGSGAKAHWRSLEKLYDSAPINRLFESRLELAKFDESRIHSHIALSGLDGYLAR